MRAVYFVLAVIWGFVWVIVSMLIAGVLLLTIIGIPFGIMVWIGGMTLASAPLLKLIKREDSEK